MPTWDDYLKKNTVGPIQKSPQKKESGSDKLITMDPKEDINKIYGDRIAKLIA